MGNLSRRVPSNSQSSKVTSGYVSKYIAFIQMKYVVATVVSMFILQFLVEYSTMGIPNLIHSLTARMKSGFPILLEKKKVDW